MSLGPWVHLIEELQVFDQEPVESLVLSRSKVVIRPHPPVPTPSLVLCLVSTGVGRHSSTPRLAWANYRKQVLTESVHRGRYI